MVKLPAYSEIFTPLQWVTVALFGYLAVFSNPILTQNYTRIDVPFFGPLGIDRSLLQVMILLAFFTYFAVNAHDLPEGIHDVEGDRKLGVKTYATSFGIRNAARISFFMFILSGLFANALYFVTILSLTFLIPFLILWIWILSHSYRLLTAKPEKMKELGKIVGRKGFDYFLISYNLIFLDVFLQAINHHFPLLP
jgi:4-hydroxybenzoate polyprenyltransferase